MRQISKATFFEEIGQMAAMAGSRYRDNTMGRDKLLRMAWANGWFLDDGTIRLEDEADFQGKIQVWLESYGMDGAGKMELLFHTFTGKFPRTCEAYREFLTDIPNSRIHDRLVLMDYVFSGIRKEIMDYTETELQPFISEAGNFLTAKQMKFLFQFLSGMGKYGMELKFRYEPAGKQNVSPENGAYPIRDYARMAYWVFNEKAWKENGTIKKAATRKIYADIWLFVALHFVCAIRAADMARLPCPELPDVPDRIREAILEGSFPRQDAASLCGLWLYRIEAMGRKPGKTAGHDVPAMKVTVPTSLREPFGIILSLAASWHEDGHPFVVRRADAQHLSNLFGKPFKEAAGRTRFQSRRANKAFLQGLENIPGEGGIQGYMLATLARSHKGGVGTLAETTATYLRDQNFTGHTPEFIAREMFERGIFGFVPVLMLEAYKKAGFRELGVRRQTELIRLVGLEPEQIERVARAIAEAMGKASRSIKEIFRADVPTTALKEALRKIAAGSAPAKQEGLLCARIATGHGCHAPDRASCLGCGCEVYTQGMLHILMSEYRGILLKKKGAPPMERKRLEALALDGILPVIGQIATTARELYPGGDISVLLDGMERGLADEGKPDREST